RHRLERALRGRGPRLRGGARADRDVDQRSHALDYLAYAYLQEGRDTAARRVVDEAAAAPAGYPAGSLTHEYAIAAIPARYALERGDWAAAARLDLRPAPEWPASEAITRF